MIRLRELKEKDAVLMLEWMHDPDVQKGLHFAIVNDDDEYLGTVSLKEIDLVNKSVEYAITLRKKAQGLGYAYIATGQVLKKAFREYGLHRVYLSVYADNVKAIRLYERCGFSYEGEFREHLKVGNHFVNWKWYGILENEYKEEQFS